MIVVIQCAANKHPEAGYLSSQDGLDVHFVADPTKNGCSRMRYARPDDECLHGKTWREILVEYNKKDNDNPNGLYPAYRLYRHHAYADLVEKFGVSKVFILSAGWGLIQSDFLTPQYDITFSNAADPFKRRRMNDHYRDLCQLPEWNTETIVFFGGKDYLPLFCGLSNGHKGRRIVFYNSVTEPRLPECELIKYETTTRTNWHYLCVRSFIEGEIAI